MYLDGYMGPSCSDHSLRRLITTHGGELSLYLSKSRITHVVLSSKGALAAGKVRKEVQATCRGNRVKYVTVDWCHDSVRAGKRLHEFEYTAFLPAGQRSVGDFFHK